MKLPALKSSKQMERTEITYPSLPSEAVTAGFLGRNDASASFPRVLSRVPLSNQINTIPQTEQYVITLILTGSTTIMNLRRCIFKKSTSTHYFFGNCANTNFVWHRREFVDY